MNAIAYQDAGLWSLVLAGGQGVRLRPLVRRLLGSDKPKQYCSFLGTRSMFQHTLDRSDRIIDPGQRVIVIAREHSDEALMQLGSRVKGKLILQPANCGTAAGVFLGVATVRALDPDATVLIFPCDHFAYPEERFVQIAYNMTCIAQSMKQWVILLGAFPDRPEPEYGWIQPGAHLGLFDGCRVRLIRTFLEKPGMAACKAAMESGAVWNTMVTAARVETLWKLGLRCVPEVMRLFEVYSESIGKEREVHVLEDIYQMMPMRDFSTHLLQECPRHILLMELKDVLWSDWGDPGRIGATLRLFGHEPELYWANLTRLAG